MATKKLLKKSKKTGRPASTAGNLRDLRLWIRLTRDEKARLLEAAESEGVTLANWIRHRLGLEAAEYGG